MLNYSSGNGNGAFGLGWELSLPEISRQTSKCIPKYDDTDTFLYTGDDYLVPLLDINNKKVTTNKTVNKINYNIDSFRSRTAGNFDLITRYTNSSDATDVFWIVTSSDNISSIFGKNKTARISDPDNGRRIFKWLLEETFDAKGNHQLFEFVHEDGENIQNNTFTKNRDITTQCYLSKIKYGNDKPIAGSILLQGSNPGTIYWHFEIAFDYGEYTLPPENNNPYYISPDSKWICRKDPFSDYRSGFEIRTYRLCQNVLLFHRFPEKEYGTADPVLVSVLSFNYNESTIFSLLDSFQLSGFTYNKTKSSYDLKSVPPLEFSYSSFNPDEPNYSPHAYETFITENNNGLSGLKERPDYRLIDLFGGGIPGVLFSDGETVRYRKPQSVSDKGITYNNAENLSFPQSRLADDPTHTLTDVNGDGHLDLLVSMPSMSGFYESRDNDSWKNWQTFESFPTQFHEPNYQHVDVTGNGLADMILISEDSVNVYPANPQKGFGPVLQKARPDDLPQSMPDSKLTLQLFSDMCGLGLAQLVRVRNGEVVCWPSLGYGTFGKSIKIDNSPNFGDDFDTGRIRIADVNGSGLSDLVYIHSTYVEIYLNQSGNAFSQIPIKIPLPENWDDLDQIQFADVLGSGAECLVFTSNHVIPKQWFYDFNQTEWKEYPSGTTIISLKPYLLIGMDNNMGAQTKIRYAGSTKFYLEDQEKGQEWITRLPFPVQVVETVTHIDQIAKTFTSVSYKYHHGFYDGFEREFRGFGRVDRTDMQYFNDFIPEDDEAEAAYNAPSLITKTWYHTGAWLEEGNLINAFKKSFGQETVKLINFLIRHGYFWIRIICLMN